MVRRHLVDGRSVPLLECVWRSPPSPAVQTITTIAVSVTKLSVSESEVTATPVVSGPGFTIPAKGTVVIMMLDAASSITIGLWTNVALFSQGSTQSEIAWTIGSTTDALTLQTTNTSYLKGPLTVSVPSEDLANGAVGVIAAFRGERGFAGSTSSVSSI
jgi:hypothetical protein